MITMQSIGKNQGNKFLKMCIAAIFKNVHSDTNFILFVYELHTYINLYQFIMVASEYIL